MVREDAPVLRGFVDYYLAQGARRVVLYYDGTCPLTPLAWPGHDIEIHNIDDAFKSRNASGDPKDLIATQEMIFTQAHAACATDWLLVVDADEFVAVPGQTIAQALRGVPAAVEAVVFPVGEAVWGPEDDLDQEFGCSYFRLSSGRLDPGLLPRLLYGDIAPLFRRGLLGHFAGKHALRRGVAVDKVGCHASRRNGRQIGVLSTSRQAGLPGSFVAHFDAISLARWEDKWSRRVSDSVRVVAMGRGRSAQVHAAGRAVQEGRARAHFQRLYALNRTQARVLRLLGLLRRYDVFGSGARSDPARPAQDHLAQPAKGARP